MSTTDFENLPSWLSDNFNILEGGAHTDQPSRNKLIVFADGTYIEIFNWMETPQKPNPWTDKSPGLIDFALTSLPPSTPESLYIEISVRLHPQIGEGPGNITFESPQAGGRTRKDGLKVKWKLTRPVPAFNPSERPPVVTASGHRQDFPFFTHDVTNRNVRIQFDDKEKTNHPCGAVGISTIEVLFPSSLHAEYIRLYENVLGVSARPLKDHPAAQEYEYPIKSPVKGDFASRILARKEQSEGDSQWIRDRGIGLRGLRLATKGRTGHGVQSLGSDQIASTICMEW
ncbi:hypothetical protein ACLMJK_004249 [Lecanora helva]